MKSALAGGVLAAGLLACSAPADVTHATGEYVRFSTSPCYGTCPVVDVFAFPDGEIVFRGWRPDMTRPDIDKTIAYDMTAIEAATYDALVDYLAAEGFAELKDVYETESQCGEVWTDSPSLNVEVRSYKISKEVEYYLGCRKFADEPKLQAIIEKVRTTLKVQDLIDANIPAQP